MSASGIVSNGGPDHSDPGDGIGDLSSGEIPPPESRSERGGPGALEWSVDLPDPSDGQVSTPCIVDLDLDGYPEILALTSGGFLMAYNHNGTPYWSSPIQVDINSIGDYEYPTTGDFDPPRFFPSPVAEDITGDSRPEILISSYTGLVCLDSYGVQLWKAGDTYGCYFGTPCITDLNGTFSGKDDLEIIVTSSAHNNTNWIEVISGNGDLIARNIIDTSLILGSTCAAQDLEGSAWDGPWQSMDPRGSDPDTEIVFPSFGNHINIIDPLYVNGTLVMNVTTNSTGGNYNMATPAIMNIEGSPDCEIIAGTSEGTGPTWENWSGRLVVFNTSGEEIWDYDLPGNGTAIMSSPVVMTKDRYYNDSDDHLRGEFDIIFGSDDGFIYCLNSSSRDLRWKFDMGGRVRSSPAIFDWTGEEDYAVVVGSDSGRIVCFELDPSEGIDHGIPYSGDGLFMDVIWIFDHEYPIGFSSPVVADIGRDRMPEVLIGDSDGNLLCLPGFDTTDSVQNHWPSFHGNNNRSGYSGFVDRYSVGIFVRHGRGTGESQYKSIKPGMFATFNITLRNECWLLDRDQYSRINLEVVNDYEDEGFVYWLDTPAYQGYDDPPFAMLGSGDVADLKLHIYSPLREFRDPGRIFEFKVRAELDGSPIVNDTASAYIWMDIHSDLNMEFDAPIFENPDDILNGSKVMSIMNGGEVIVDLHVENNGNVNDTFNISLPDPLDLWDWYFMNDGSREITVNLSTPIFENESHITGMVLPVMIRCHKDAEGGMIGQIEVDAVSEFFESNGLHLAFNSDILYIRVNEVRELQMIAEEPILHAGPGETISFAIDLTNAGNTYIITAHLGFTNLTPEWGGSFSKNPVDLFKMKSKTIYLNMTIPADRPAGEVVDIDVVADLYPYMNRQFHVGLNVVVDQVHSIRALLTDDLISGYPGDIIFSGIIIENQGNGLEEISLHVRENDLFTITFTMGDGVAFKPVVLSPGDNLSVRSRVYIRESMLAGTYSSIVTIEASEANLSLDQRIEVGAVHSIQVTSMKGLSGLMGTISPGGSTELAVNLSNTGNCLSRFRLHFDYGASPEDRGNISRYHSWVSRFTWVSMDPGSAVITGMIPMGEVVNTTILDRTGRYGLSGMDGIDHVDLIIRAGISVYVGIEVDLIQFSMGDRSRSIVFDIDGIPMEGGGGDKIECVLNMLLPDLEFSTEPTILSQDGSVLPESRDGDAVIIRISVRNIGTLGADHVILTLFVDDDHLDEVTIASIGSGGMIETVDFEITLRGGDHVLRLEIDLENDIVEDRDQFSNGGDLNNNEVSMSFGVQETEGSGIESLLAFLITIIPIMVIIIVVILAAKKFGKAGDGIEE